jgi:hypothetical protein
MAFSFLGDLTLANKMAEQLIDGPSMTRLTFDKLAGMGLPVAGPDCLLIVYPRVPPLTVCS